MAALLFASLAFLAALAWPCFLGRVWIADDLSAFHLPIRDFYRNCLRQGVPFDWMDSLYGGCYFTGEGQAGAYHPWHGLLYRILSLEGAFAAELLVNYPLLLAGCFVWLRRHVETSAAALFGAFCFTFGSFNVLHFVHVNALSVIAHVPWLLACQARFADPKSRRLIALAVPLLTASQILLGYPQYVWFTLLAELAYGLAEWRRNGRFWLSFVGLKVLGLTIGAVQLLPTFDWLDSSARIAATSAFFNDYSVSPLHCLLFASPHLASVSHEFSLYLGIVPTACLVVGACHEPERASRLWKYCVACVACAFLLALGKYGGVFLLQRLLPVVGNFRVPARYLFLVQLALCPLVARGFERWTRLADSERETAGRLWWRCFLMFAALSLVPLLRVEGLLRWACVAPPLFAALAWRLLCKPTADFRWDGLLLIGLVWIDLLLFGATVGSFTKSVPAGEPRDLVAPPGPPHDRLALQPDTLGPHGGAYYSNELVQRGWRQIDGYSGLPPRNLLLGEGAGLNALRVANVQWVYVASVPDEFVGLAEPHAGWREVPEPLPRVRLVGEARISSDPRKDVETIDPARIALLDAPLDESLEAAPDAKLVVQEERPGLLRAETDAAGRQLLVFAERFHRGWKATVDGEPVEIVRVYGDFQGCVVEPGTHQVSIHFDPDSLRWGKRLTIAGLLALLAVAWFVGRAPATRAALNATER